MKLPVIPLWLKTAVPLALGLYGGWQLEHWRSGSAVAKAEARTADLERDVAKVAADALTEQKRQAEEFRANNARARAEYAQSLDAIERDRRADAGRLQSAYADLARLRALSEAGDRSRAAELAALTGRVREVEQADADLHAACRADAAQLGALIEEIRPQL